MENSMMDHGGLIGAKLRALRRSQGMTLKDLAARTGTSTGHLSQLERDMASPSVKTLYVISRALGVTISEFFDVRGGNAADSPYIIRKNRRRHIQFSDGIDDYRLTSDAIKHVGLLYSTFQPGASIEAAYTHEGEEAGYVVSGQLELYLAENRTILEVGDSFSFPSLIPHRYGNPGITEAVVIWAMTPPTY